MENSVKEKIENLINESEVMLFMKGTPEMPQCYLAKIKAE